MLEMVNSSSSQIRLIRKYLKVKLLEDKISFKGQEKERKHVYDLIMKSILQGESHSALIIGPRGSGKTTLLNSILHQVSKQVDMASDVLIVKLNGLLHQDEKVALKSITTQMQLENAVGDRVFGTFAENLSFLLNCLMAGADRSCKSMIFVLEELDLFCHSGRTQSLLYNLFDITNSKQAPMCVLGTTNRLDVMELLEKRVKSRFSHRLIYLLPHEKTPMLDAAKDTFVQCLSMPICRSKPNGRTEKSFANEAMDCDDQIQYSVPEEVFQVCNMDTRQFAELEMEYLLCWNAHIQSLVSDEKVIDALEKISYYVVNEQILRNILFQLVSKISPNKPFIDVTDITSTIDNTVSPESKRRLLQSLSILELSLVIAMMHGMDIFDGQPMNFEMVLHRYTKFASQNSSTQTVPRPVVLKAFEHLQSLEIIQAVRGDTSGMDTTSRVQKEYKLYSLTVPPEDVREAVKGFRSLPTEITHWVNNSIV